MTMSVRELFQALVDGKKVRNKYWSSDTYIYLHDKEIRDELDKASDWVFEVDDICDYEIYEEQKAEDDEKDIAFLTRMRAAENRVAVLEERLAELERRTSISFQGNNLGNNIPVHLPR